MNEHISGGEASGAVWPGWISNIIDRTDVRQVCRSAMGDFAGATVRARTEPTKTERGPDLVGSVGAGTCISLRATFDRTIEVVPPVFELGLWSSNSAHGPALPIAWSRIHRS